MPFPIAERHQAKGAGVKRLLLATIPFLAILGGIQAAQASDLEVVAEFTDKRPGNIAVTPSGRIVVSMQPLDGPEFRALEVMPDGSMRPFPTLDWADGPEAGETGLSAVIGIAADDDGVVWMLDMGGPQGPAQVVAWDTVREQLHARIDIPTDTLVSGSFLQDFALDSTRKRIYIADMTFVGPSEQPRPAFVVLDLETGEAWRTLEGHPELMPVDRDVVIDGSLMASRTEAGETAPLRLGINPIAIDPQNEWVYFGTVNGSELYRIPAAVLAESSADEAARAAAIEPYRQKRPSDGIVVDASGNVYVTDIEGSAVGVAASDGYHVLAQDDERLSWPDGFALASDGWLYVTQNHLHGHPALNEGEVETAPPYRILRLRPRPAGEPSQ